MDRNKLWDSGQILDIIFDIDFEGFIKFAEKTINAEITFIQDECLYEVKCKGKEYKGFFYIE